MADININPVNVSGLAQLAGRDMPALHLPLSPITTASSAVAQQNALTNQGIAQQHANALTTEANNQLPIAQMQQAGDNTRQANLLTSQQHIANQVSADRQQRTAAIQNIADQKTRMSKSDDEMKQHQALAVTVTMGLNKIDQDTSMNADQKMQKKQDFIKQTNDAAYAKGLYSSDPVVNKQIYLQHQSLTPDQAAQTAQMEYVKNMSASDAKQKGGVVGQVAQMNGSAAAEEKPEFGKSLMTSTASQKDFTSDIQNDRNLKLGLQTAHTLDGQLRSIPQDAFNPLTGELNAKYSAQGEAIKKNMNTLVVQAPSILGLPASALRAATVWKMIQDSKPNAQLWTAASRAMIDDIKYMGALQQQSNWEDEAQKMRAQALVGGPGAKRETADWMANNPEPIKSQPMPNLTEFNKLFPQMKGQLEQDWETVKNKGASTGGTSAPSPQSSLYTSENIAHTAKLHGVSEDEVRAKLGIK